jgi:hypothetical protein
VQHYLGKIEIHGIAILGPHETWAAEDNRTPQIVVPIPGSKYGHRLLLQEGTRTTDDAVGDDDSIAFGHLRLPGERLHFKFSLVKWAIHDASRSFLKELARFARRGPERCWRRSLLAEPSPQTLQLESKN